jgi:hypothetical protein
MSALAAPASGARQAGEVIMRNSIAALTCAAAALALGAPADGQSEIRTDTVYENISPADLRVVIDGLGHPTVTTVDATSFEVVTSSGFLFNVFAMSCSDETGGKGGGKGASSQGGCFGMEISASWSVDSGEVAGVTVAADAYNERYSLLKSYVDDEGSLRAQRYAITDGGVTSAHLEQEIQVFLSGVDFLLETVKTETGLDFIAPDL